MKEMLAVALILLASLTVNSAAKAGDKEKSQQHSAHVHGEAVLNLVLEEQSVLVELLTPAVNVLGFEHQPATAEQRKAVDHAVGLLKKYANVFQFDAGGCRQTSVDMEAPFADDGEHHSDNEHTDERDHDPHHDKGESEHKEPGHNEEHDNHSEFHVVYQLACSKPQAISAVDMTIFKHFPGFEKIRVQWVGANGQGMSKASQTRTEVLLKP